MGSVTRKRLLWLGVGVLAFGLSQADSPAISQWKVSVAQALLQRSWSEPVAEHGTGCSSQSGAKACPVARLSIPGQRAARIVLRQASERAPVGGWGHLAGTPLPGAVGNAVFRIYAPQDRVLLQRLRRGDTLVVELPDARQFAYRVTEARMADRRAIRVEYRTHGPELTLISRAPGDTQGDMRLVISAALLPAPRVAGMRLAPARPLARQLRTTPTA
ncbi:MAG: sortase [Betaproteobacteria bacterium]|jgi:sortase A|nr:sortase [Betaproteobacteria bacterium]